MLLKTLNSMSIEEKNAILNRVQERASSYQFEYCGCGRSIALSLLEEFDIPYGDLALKAASFSCLGIARTGNTCGALIGGIIALGLAYGGNNNDYYSQIIHSDAEDTHDERTYEVVQKYCRKFEQEMGGFNCRDIQQKLFGRTYNLLNPAEHREFTEENREQCSVQVGKAARLVAEAMLEMTGF
jgi:C_GCAxxG_C_C family probable redox protein